MISQLCKCVDCGADFEGHYLSLRCPPCRAIRHNQIKREGEKQRRARNRAAEMAERRTGVIVTYCDGGSDKYSRSSFLEWLKHGAFKSGDEYQMDGKRFMVS